MAKRPLSISNKSKIKQTYKWNKVPVSENELFRRKVDRLPRYKDTNHPDPAAFADLMLKTYPDLFEALHQSELQDKQIENVFKEKHSKHSKVKKKS